MKRLAKADFEAQMNDIIDNLQLGLYSQRSLFFSPLRTSRAELEYFCGPYKLRGYNIQILARENEWEVYITY